MNNNEIKINNKKLLTTESLMLIPMFSALTAVLAQIFIPLPFTPVPVNLAMLAVFLGAGLLGGMKGAISQIIYLFLGAIGLPVFAGFTAGLGILVGPTGGYLVGYVIASLTIGILFQVFPKGDLFRIGAMIVGLVFCYTLGTLWFMFVMNTQADTKTNMELIAALTLCVLPFIPGDILKIMVAFLLIKRLKKTVKFY